MRADVVMVWATLEWVRSFAALRMTTVWEITGGWWRRFALEHLSDDAGLVKSGGRAAALQRFWSQNFAVTQRTAPQRAGREVL